MRHPTALSLIGIFRFLTLSNLCSASIVINEIAPKGTSNFCSGHDWIELFNNGTEAVDLSNGYILHDNRGINDPNTFQFPTDTLLGAQSYLVLCNKVKANGPAGDLAEVPDPMSPQFGIGKEDTITLVKVRTSNLNNANLTTTVTQGRSVLYELVSTVGPLSDIHEETFDVTFARDPSISSNFTYTSTPTPGASNIITALKTHQERIQEIRDSLTQQNALGTAFFNMDHDGLPVEDGMDDVLEFHMDMDQEDYDYITQNANHELYRPFQSARMLTVDGEEIASFTSPGRIRPKGQSTLYISQCLGTRTIPFQIDMDHTNSNQTLFGVQRLYLRHHMKDNSYMRDWSYNRMLARFGLPHLRSRHVTFYINDQLMGFYTLMEAPEQEFVFARNFPTYVPGDSEENPAAIYKVTNLGVTCGEYTQEQIHNATIRLDETSTPPYAFERGEHRQPVQNLGFLNSEQCTENYLHDTEVRDKEDVVLAWLRYNRDCPKMRMGEGLVDRKLGSSDWDDAMEDFLRNHLDRSIESCDPGCANSDLKDDIDVENFLKTIAFYAVTMDMDSPIGPGFNHYLVQTGDGSGWKLQAYDFNYPLPVECPVEICSDRMIHWSIVRPTCRALEENRIVGPLLSDPDLQSQYLGYVQDFVDNVYGNSSLIDQMTLHVNAIRRHASRDIFSTLGVYIQYELSQDAAEWDTEGNLPLLPTMLARTLDVRAQLQAISDGTFPRGHLVSATDNTPWETCADWRAEEPDTSACDLGCRYAGCHIDGWTIESYCDEKTGTCYHGDYDEACHNIVNGDQYTGMQNRLDGRPTFCRYAQGLPVKASECPSLGGGTVVSIIAGEVTRTTTLQSAARARWSMLSWTASISLLLGSSIMLEF